MIGERDRDKIRAAWQEMLAGPWRNRYAHMKDVARSPHSGQWATHLTAAERRILGEGDEGNG